MIFLCSCFQNIQHLANDCALIEFHLEIYDNTATPKSKKIPLYYEKPIEKEELSFPDLIPGLIYGDFS